MSPALVVFGNLLLDDVVYADGSTRMRQPGGAVLYLALAARLWGVEVGVVSRVGKDYPEEILTALADRGIALDGISTLEGPTLRTWLLYEDHRRRVIHRLDGPSHGEVSPGAGELPAAWSPRWIHLAPMPWEVHQELTRDLADTSLRLSLDPYELLTDDNLSGWAELLRSIDLLFLSEDEMTITGGLETPRLVLERLTVGISRLEHVLYKQGRSGGLLFDTRRRSATPWRAGPAHPVDPTGAGDAFAGGVLAGLLLGDPLERAIIRGVLSADFAVSAWGADGLLGVTPEQASANLRSMERL